MGFMISINGVDFEPYRAVSESSPLVPKVLKTRKTAEVHRGSPDVDESFDQAMQRVLVKNYEVSSKPVKEEKRRERRAIWAKDLMTHPVIFIGEEIDSEQAKEILEQKGFRHLPVVDNESRVKGLVSDRDLLALKESFPIVEVMSRRVLVATPRTQLSEVIEVMLSEKIHCLPIVDDERKLIGILTSTDLLRGAFKNPAIEIWV